MLSAVCRFHDASIIADVHHLNTCLREGDRSLVGVDAEHRIGVAPPMPYLSPVEALVVSTIKSHVACHDVLWVDGIHGKHPEADIIGVCAAVGAIKAIGWDLNPSRPAIYRLI